MAGYVDGGSSKGIVSRLNSIRAERRAWRNPFLKRMRTITIPSQDWIEARSHKDIISGRTPDQPEQLDIVNLSSEVSERDRIAHIQFDVKLDAHYIDPGQDLVVLASLTQTLDAA